MSAAGLRALACTSPLGPGASAAIAETSGACDATRARTHVCVPTRARRATATTAKEGTIAGAETRQTCANADQRVTRVSNTDSTAWTRPRRWVWSDPPAERRLGVLRWLALCVGLAVAMPAIVVAEEGTSGVTLRWHGSERCPLPSSVMTETEALLGHVLSECSPLAVQVDLQALADGSVHVAFQAQGNTRRAERELTLASCEEAAHAVALLIAMTLDSDESITTPVTAHPPPETEPSAALAAMPRTAVGASLPLSVASQRVGAPAHAGAAVGVAAGLDPWALSQLTAVIAPRLAWRSGAVEFEADARFWLPARAHASAAVDLALDLFGVGVFACYWFPLQPLEWGPALGVEVSRVHATISGSDAGAAAWVRVWLGPRVGWWLSGAFKLTLSAEAFLSVNRASLSSQDAKSARAPLAGFVPNLAVTWQP